MKKEMLDSFLSAFYEACQKNNLKLTPQRVEVYKELVKFNDHPSVTKIYKRVKQKFPNISFDTVNRTLQLFVEIGVAKLVEGVQDIRRYDGVTKRHNHFHCLKCNKIIDIYDERLDKIEIPKDLYEKLSIIDTKIVFNGLCEKCKK
ncbi:TPA: transcriptional repressor [Candidatus Poribacteria bacterium]|jgi:Fur family peroxide stress response transcriptional regulator|nr:transcriptional repressor [Candidatus Poribacteria bacterium]